MENPGITIRDRRYDLPTLDTVTLAEERVLFLYGDCVVRDFIPAHPEATDDEKAAYERLQLLRLRNPDFKRALAYIAIRRQDQEMEDAAVWQLAGEANALETDIAMLWGDSPDPPAQSSQKPLENKTNTSGRSSSTDSGSSTGNGSETAAGIPVPTGISG